MAVDLEASRTRGYGSPVHVEVEVLLRDRAVGAVGADVGDRLVELRLQLGVALAHRDARAGAEVLRVAELGAEEREVLARRALEEADVGGDGVFHRRVDAAGGE